MFPSPLYRDSVQRGQGVGMGRRGDLGTDSGRGWACREGRASLFAIVFLTSSDSAHNVFDKMTNF
jgi:hypothetical protein